MALQKTVEKDDLLTKMRIREVLLFGLIALAAILAQLPAEGLEDHGINRNYLLGVLGCGIVLGLFFYLRFFFFLAVVLLILAADQQISEYIQISKIPVILVGRHGRHLAHQLLREADADGPGAQAQGKDAEGVARATPSKNGLVYANKVLLMNFESNMLHDNGYTPLAYGGRKKIKKQRAGIVELLLRNGADPSMTKDGDTPVELALRLGHAEVADLLRDGAAPCFSGTPGGSSAKGARNLRPASAIELATPQAAEIL